jgi:hypothetical protein
MIVTIAALSFRSCGHKRLLVAVISLRQQVVGIWAWVCHCSGRCTEAVDCAASNLHTQNDRSITKDGNDVLSRTWFDVYAAGRYSFWLHIARQRCGLDATKHQCEGSNGRKSTPPTREQCARYQIAPRCNAVPCEGVMQLQGSAAAHRPLQRRNSPGVMITKTTRICLHVLADKSCTQ